MPWLLSSYSQVHNARGISKISPIWHGAVSSGHSYCDDKLGLKIHEKLIKWQHVRRLLPISKVLVAVDGSKPSLNASIYAIDFAKKNEAELIVLCIVSPVTYSQFEYANVGRLREIEKAEKDKAEHDIDKVKQKATENNVKVKTEVLIKYTSAVKEIVEYAEINNIDLIVLGSRGRTGFKKLLLGSVANGVVTYSRCPVLVVKWASIVIYNFL